MRNSVSRAENGSRTPDQIFKALGDPHRLQILHLLSEREMSAGEILEKLDVVQSTLSHHMKSLTEAGAVNAVRRGKWTYYSINKETVKEAESFLHGYASGTRVMLNPEEGKQKETAKGDKKEDRKGKKNKKGKKIKKI